MQILHHKRSVDPWSLSREPGGQTVAEEFEASLEGGPVWPPAQFRSYEREYHVGELVVELGGLPGGEAGRVLQEDGTRRAGQTGQPFHQRPSQVLCLDGPTRSHADHERQSESDNSVSRAP